MEFFRLFIQKKKTLLYFTIYYWVIPYYYKTNALTYIHTYYRVNCAHIDGWSLSCAHTYIHLIHINICMYANKYKCIHTQNTHTHVHTLLYFTMWLISHPKNATVKKCPIWNPASNNIICTTWNLFKLMFYDSYLDIPYLYQF